MAKRPNAYDNALKAVVVGDSQVGKTALIFRYVENVFESKLQSTIGVDFSTKTITVADKRVRLVLWDTAGQERFRALAGSYYRGAHIAVVMFDITNAGSFDNLNAWMEEVALYSTNPKIVKLLLGNKIDLASERAVSVETAIAFAKTHDMIYLETSVKTNSGVEQAFFRAVQTTLACSELSPMPPAMATASLFPIHESEAFGTANLYCC